MSASPYESGLKSTRDYWNDRAQNGKDDCERVEQSKRAQSMRFEAFAHFHNLDSSSVLDIGCGTGGFYEHLLCRGTRVSYSGFDVSEEMVAICNAKFPGVPVYTGDFNEWHAPHIFDYTVAFAIHNVKVDGARELLQLVTRKQFDLCTKAAHISLLTARFDKFAEHILPWKPEEILSLALDITPYVVLRHDYLPNDFSITLYREPLIDTCPSLLLHPK